MPYADDHDDEIESYKFDDSDAQGDDLTDWANQDGVDTVKCPKCGRQVYEEAEQCHYCGHWIDRQHRARLPMWVIVTAVICLLMAIFLTLMGGGLFGR